MYKFSPGLGTPLKYNPCDTKVSTASTCNVASSPTKVKSNSALVANEKPVDSRACVTVLFNVSEVSLAIASINPKVCVPTNNDCPTVSCDVMAATAGGVAPTTGSGLTLNVPNIDFGIDEQVKHNDETISYTTGTITGISIVQSGGSGYTTSDTIFIGAPNIGGNERATATVSVSSAGVIQSITVTNAGKGYVTAPAVTITSSGSGTNATATATLNSDGGVESITVDSGGSGYDFISTTISIENATSGGRQATASITSVDGSGAITGVSLTDAGTGYTAKPISPVLINFLWSIAETLIALLGLSTKLVIA